MKKAPKRLKRSGARAVAEGILLDEGKIHVLLPPKTARTSHEIRTDFIRGHFSESFYFRSIPNDTYLFPANFRSFLNKKDPKHVSVPWVLIGSFSETLGVFWWGKTQGVQG